MNNFAISSQGIGVALQKSASALAAANNDLEESIALITAMNAVIQDPEKVGTALKTVSMYLRAAKTEAEEAGESTEGMAKSVSKLREELLILTSGKVDIMIDENTFKSTYQIMKELSEVWSELADIDTASILELIGGKRNAAAVTSLLTNFKDAESALKSATNAMGSAAAENEKYLSGIEGKLDILKAKFEAISYNLIDGNFIKGLLSIASVLADIIEWLTRFPAIITLIGASIAGLNLATQRKTLNQIVEVIMLQRTSIVEEKIVTDQLATSVAVLNAAQQKLLVTRLQNKLSSNAITKAEYDQIIATLGLTTASTGLSVANKGLAASFKTLMASIPIWGWISLGITLVIEITMAIVNLKKNTESTTEKISSLSDEFKVLSDSIKKTSDEFKSLKDSTESIIPRFTELAKGVNMFGENVSLTNGDYDEFVTLNNKIAELFPEVNLGMDSNGNAMLALSYNADTLADSLRDLVDLQRELANQKIAATMPDVLENIINTEKEYNNQLKGINKEREDWASIYDDISNQTLNTYIGHFNSVQQGMVYAEKIIERARTLGLEGEIVYNTLERLGGQNRGKHLFGVEWNYESVDVETLERLYGIKSESLDKVEENIINQMKSSWGRINSVVSAWLATNPMYQNLDTQMQQIATLINRGLDYDKLNLNTEEKIHSFLERNILLPLDAASVEVKEAFSSLLDFEDLVKKGEMTPTAFAEVWKSAYNSLLNSMNPKLVNEFKNALVNGFRQMGYEGRNFEEVLDNVATSQANLLAPSKSNSISTIISNFRQVINVLKEVANEQENTGAVTVETYKNVIELNEDYADLFDFTSGQIRIQVDELEKLVENLLNEEAARLAVNGATDEQIAVLATLLKSLKKSKNSNDDLIKSIDNLQSHLDKINDGYEYSSLEILNLLSQYPQLATGIQETTNGYKLQEVAVVSLIKSLAKLIETQQTVAMLDATELFLTSGGGTRKSEANIDEIFGSYENKYGKAIASWDEFVTGWEDKFQRSAEGVNWVGGIQDYVESKINEVNATGWTEKIISDLQEGIIKPGSGSSSKKDEPKWLTDFKFAVTTQQHLVSMAVLTQKEYIDWLDGAYKSAFANDRSGEYITDMWKYEEEVFKFRTEAAQSSIDAYLEYAKKLYDVHQNEEKYLNDITWALNRYDATMSDSQRTNILKNIEDANVAYFDNIIEDLNHQADIIARTEEDSGAKRIQIYQQILEELLKKQKYYLDQGYDANSKQLQDVEKAYNSFVDKITDIVEDAFEKTLKEQEKFLEETIKNLEDAEDALDIVLDAVVDHLKRRKQAEIDSLKESVDQQKKHYDNLLDETKQYYKDTTDSAKKSYDSQKEDMTKYYDELIENIESTSKAQTKALKDELEGYKKIIDAKKESLQASRDEDKYNQNVADKNKNIASLQRQIDILSLDTSDSARAERLKLEEELSKAIRDLNEYQTDYSLNLQLKALDDEYDRFKEVTDDKIALIENETDITVENHKKQKESYLENLEIQNKAYLESLEKQQEAAIQAIEFERDSRVEALEFQITEIEEYLKKEGVLRRDANALLLEEGEALWSELMAYEYDYSKSITELENAWEIANGAMNRYNNGQMNVLSTLGTMINMLREYNAQLASITNVDQNTIIAQMRANSQSWLTATPEQQNFLHQQNQYLGQQAGLVYNPNDGHWYKDGVIAYTAYHSGAERGFVQGDSRYVPLKSHEEFAKLAAGELVITPPQIDNILGGFKNLFGNIPAIKSPNYNIGNLVGLNIGNVSNASLDDVKKVVTEGIKTGINKMYEPMKRRGIGSPAINLSI